MRIRSVTSKIKFARKRTLALFLVPVVALSVAGAVTAQTNLMEGNTRSLNVTTGETQYSETTNAKASEVVQVQLWLHNRANPDGERAHNTQVRIEVPQNQPGTTQAITGTTTTSNMNTVTDTTNVVLPDNESFIEYLPGTARYRYNKGAADGDQSCETGFSQAPAHCYDTVGISDNVVNGGVNLDQIRGGPLRGCDAHHETVTIQVRVKKPPEEKKKLQLTKQVKELGIDGWHNEIKVEPGDKAQFLLGTKNLGNTDLTTVGIKDALPAHLKFIPGSIEVIDQHGEHPQPDGPLFGNGINLGTYKPGGAKYVLFKVKALDDFKECEVRVRNKAIANADQLPDGVRDTADIVIKKPDCPVKKPVFKCELLTKEHLGGARFRFTVDATAEDSAEIKQYRFDFGDGTEELITDNNTVEHEFAVGNNEDATFVTRATVDFDVDGESKSHTSQKCQVVIEFVAEDEERVVAAPVEPGVPAQLPEAGAPALVGAFMGVSTLSGGLYHLVLRRRLID